MHWTISALTIVKIDIVGKTYYGKCSGSYVVFKLYFFVVVVMNPVRNVKNSFPKALVKNSSRFEVLPIENRNY